MDCPPGPQESPEGAAARTGRTARELNHARALSEARSKRVHAEKCRIDVCDCQRSRGKYNVCRQVTDSANAQCLGEPWRYEQPEPTRNK